MNEEDLSVKIQELLHDVKPSWRNILFELLNTEKCKIIISRLMKEMNEKNIYPKFNLILNCFKFSDFHEIKVVILGQDPYHGPFQAIGLAFSVSEELKKIPPSLKRIFKEADVTTYSSGNLVGWAEQGVLLLNTILTVEENKPGSHSNWGWEAVTDRIIFELSEKINSHQIVFMLWGKKAQEKEIFIDSRKHIILKNSHPSPLSTKGDFIGSKCFDKANEYLIKQSLNPIDWKKKDTSAVSTNNNNLNNELIDKKLSTKKLEPKIRLPDSYYAAIENPMEFPCKVKKINVKKNRKIPK